jgi:DNA repair protein RadC
LTDYRIEDLPEDDRPREKLRKKGPSSLSNSELLALIIRAGAPGKNVVELCQEILSDFDFEHLSKSSAEELKEYKGISDVKAGQIVAAFELARRCESKDISPGEQIEGLTDIINYMGPEMRRLEREELHLLHLSNSNQLLKHEILHKGSLNEVSIKNREVVKSCLKQNASAVLLAHNHPDGSPNPTDQDRAMTESLREALNLVDVNLIDHVIFGQSDHFSFNQKGLL